MAGTMDEMRRMNEALLQQLEHSNRRLARFEMHDVDIQRLHNLHQSIDDLEKWINGFDDRVSNMKKRRPGVLGIGYTEQEIAMNEPLFLAKGDLLQEITAGKSLIYKLFDSLATTFHREFEGRNYQDENERAGKR
jgi:hypothetical protein